MPSELEHELRLLLLEHDHRKDVAFVHHPLGAVGEFHRRILVSIAKMSSFLLRRLRRRDARKQQNGEEASKSFHGRETLRDLAKKQRAVFTQGMPTGTFSRENLALLLAARYLASRANQLIAETSELGRLSVEVFQ